ncbi:MAG TPA: urate hydroxylase PuuD [Candidatus Limnocylindria bacterium]|nr:urate hydroxylase PuuD [Candidatus Limnocylindria bacterium]
MDPLVSEWLELILRWAHVIAAVMWIGDSFLFMWMDSSLTAPSRTREGTVVGELWMVHSGGFYEVVKRRSLAPGELPQKLHWFKWEAYTTWLSGFFLLIVVSYLGGGGILWFERGLPPGGPWAAFGWTVLLLVAGWLAYDALWRSPLARRPVHAALVSFALIGLGAFGLTSLYGGRAGYLTLGAMLGTIMAANVWRRIIPAQNQMLAATRAGRPVDVSLGERAKTRSIHNHYLTLPVVFTMLSSHFPTTYGSRWSWLVLLLVFVFGAAAKYVMNRHARSNRLVVLAGVAALVAVVALTTRTPVSATATADLRAHPPVRYETVRTILELRCTTCHAATPSNPAFPRPPAGVVVEEPKHVRRLAQRILVRAVVTRTMPPANLTGMTDDERRQLGAWIVQGAHLEPAGP